MKLDIDSFRESIEKNKRIVTPVSILIILLCILFIINNYNNFFQNYISSTHNESSEIELLPVQQREIFGENIDDILNSQENIENEKISSDKGIDPFIGPITLTGVIAGGKGSNVAILQIGNTTYVVSEGEVILDYWTVEEIENNFIILKAGENSHKVQLL